MNRNKSIAGAVAVFFTLGASSAIAAHHEGGESEAEKIKCEGVNECKGHSACKTEANACAGQNGCAGKGFKKMTAKECEEAKAAMEKKDM